MSWMTGRNRPNYLFSDGNLDDSLRQQAMRAMQAIEAIPEAQFKSLSDAEIAIGVLTKFRVTPLRLREDEKTMRRSETKVDVSAWPDRNPFRDHGPIYVNGINVIISIPFDGEPDLWKLRPSTYQSIFPVGEVRAQNSINGGTLDIVIERPSDENPEVIKGILEQQLQSIRFYIQNQQQQIATEMSQLPARLGPAVTARRQRLAKHDNLSSILGIPEGPSVSAPTTSPRPVPAASTRTPESAPRGARALQKWDVFISHASEDKDEFVRPLADALRSSGLRVWFDEYSLKVGDSLRRSIDRGLANSRFGIVVISPHFLEKKWPQLELDGLVAREVGGQKVILPVWHNVDRQTVARCSPMLADRVATSSAKGLTKVVQELKAAIDDH